MWKKIIVYCLVSFFLGFAVATWVFPPASQKVSQPVDMVAPEPVTIDIEGATVVVPGTSPIKDGIVLNSLNQPAKNDAPEYSAEAPQLSKTMPADKLPKDGIQLNVSRQEIVPPEFTVKAGQPVILKVSAVDQWTHILVFDGNLSGLTIGLNGGENKVLVFNAPEKAGEYPFHDDIFGVAGKMIVQ